MIWFRRLVFALLFWPVPAAAEDVLIFAAASLKEPLDRIVADWPGAKVSYGGSGALARQVQQGAPADVVLLANDDWMDVLVAEGAVDDPVAFAGNRLVLVGQPGMGPVDLTAEGISGALGVGRLAMGFTASVPAGIYGRQAIESLGLWDMLAARVAEVDNVRAALALVARGEAPLGIVYATDARVVPDLAVVAVFPVGTHDPIRYWGAVVSDSETARAFLDSLTTEAAQAVLAEAGFCPPTAACEGE